MPLPIFLFFPTKIPISVYAILVLLLTRLPTNSEYGELHMDNINIECEPKSIGIRLPLQLESKDLFLHQNGCLLLVSEDELKFINEKRKYNNSKNSILEWGEDKKVYLTEEGDAFIINKPLGEGKFGEVKLAQNIDDGAFMAAKECIFSPRGSEGKTKERYFNKEKENLQGLGKLAGQLNMLNKESKQKTIISIFPYVHGIDYKDINNLNSKKTGLLIVKAIEALAEFHDKGYLHLDINPGNLKWDEKEKKCTLIDLGNANKGLEKKDVTILGPQGALAPELDPDKIIKVGRTYTTKTEMFSMGILIEDLLDKVTDKNSMEFIELQTLVAALKSSAEIRPDTLETIKKSIEVAEKIGLDPTYLNSTKALFERMAAKMILEPLERLTQELNKITISESLKIENVGQPAVTFSNEAEKVASNTPYILPILENHFENPIIISKIGIGNK